MADRSKNFTRDAAYADFENAFRKGFWRALVAWLTMSENRLLPFDEVLRRYELKGQHSIGMQVVPIEKVVGSVGRYRDFDNIFLPRQMRTRDRWISIDQAHLTDTPLPAVELYKVGDEFFVKDGNHRISVAREKGQKFIDAYVTEINLGKPVKDLDLIAHIREREKEEFYQKTRLDKLIPSAANIELTQIGSYAKIIEHIEVHRWFMGENRKKPVSWEEAVKDWYLYVYLPLIRVIRENKVLKDFPDRREADLYLWIIEHLWYLREAYQQEVSLEKAVEHFADEYSQRPLRWILKFFRSLSATDTHKD